MFFVIDECDTASYVDENTPNHSNFNIDTNKQIETNNQHMKPNADKCHLLVTSTNNLKATIEETIIKNSKKNY